jgi:hypothetical protein
MRVGVTGHQAREGIDWEWTAATLREALKGWERPLQGWSSLAVGADQVFARTILQLGGSLVTVVPGPWYEQCFDGQTLDDYQHLLSRGESETLHGLRGEDAFLAAGLEVADRTDKLVAIWDGEPAQGLGGTADIVDHARSRGKPILHIDPIRRTVAMIDPEGHGPT